MDATQMQARGWIPFAATFAAFWARAYDFIRMAAISRANLKLIGSHAGVSIGKDGPSQMGLDTKLAVHAMPGSATPEEQLRAAGIDARAIDAAAQALAADRAALR